MAEAREQMPITVERIVSMSAMEDLVKVSDELGKPIIHQTPATPDDQHTYSVVDEPTC